MFCLILLLTYFVSDNVYSETRLDTDTPGAGKSWWPMITSDNSGHVYVTWRDDRNGKGDIYFNYSSDYGATWQASDIRLDTNDTAGANNSRWPTISSDNSGHVFVTWNDRRDVSTLYDIYFNYSSDYGASWSGDIRLDTDLGANHSVFPQIIYDGSGYVYVAWLKLQCGAWSVFLNYSGDYGANWQANATRLDTDPGANHSLWPEIISDGSGHVYVTWEEYRNGSADVYFSHSSDYGVSWSSDKRIDNAPGASDSWWPHISCDGSGYVYVTWYDERDVGADIYFYYSSNYGATWQASDIRLDIGDTAGTSESLWPEIITDSNGNVYVTWDDSRNGAADIYFDALSPDPGGDPTQTTTVVNIGDNWRYFKGTSNPAAGWTDISFDDSAWLVGPTGIGYNDGDDATVLADMKGNYLTVYARKTFTVSDASTLVGMTFRMDYDDGFVAYINGQEVTRASMPAGTPAFDTAATANHEAGTAVVFDLDSYTGYLVTGTNVLAIQIHNKKIGDNDLSMIPELDIENSIGGGQNDITAPSIPANLTATAFSQTKINLSWDASTDDIGVTGYNIFRDGGGIPIATTTGTTYQDTGLSASTLYTYNVSAIDAVPNESAQSSQASDTTFAPDTTSPSTPANLTATAVSPYQINLSWDASTDAVGVTGYKIYRDGGGTPIVTVTGTTYQNTGLSPGTLYTYNVTAIDDESNESAQSSPDSDTTNAPDTTNPSIPANLTATAVSPSRIDLSWDASADNVGVTGYKIYRDTTLIDTITGTTYQDTGLSPSTSYIYSVSAIDGAPNESAQSSPDSDTTLNTTTTVINTGDNWKYFKGYSEPTMGWTSLVFADESWLVGPTGIGMGDNDDATELADMKGNYLTVYARKTFNVINASWVTGMSLRMDYDDGFVAYINGQEVTRASMPAGTPAFDTKAIDHEAGTPETFDLGAYTGELVTGTNVLVIEIHNKKIGDKDLSMIPELDIDMQ